MRIRRHGRILTAFLLTIGWIATLAIFATGAAQAAADTVDEIHYSFGNTPDAVVFDWHGAETRDLLRPGRQLRQPGHGVAFRSDTRRLGRAVRGSSAHRADA